MFSNKQGLRLALRLSLAAGLVLLLSLNMLGQSTISTGSIVGTVTDPSGAIVSGAKVAITNTGTGSTSELTSNSAGAYNSGAITPGTYKVQVSAKGFSTVTQTVVVQVGNTSTVNAKLQLGQENQVIEVQGSTVAVNTEQATVQGVLTANQIENLPVNGRNFLDLAQLEPGVQIQDGTNFDPTKVGYSSISFGGRFGRTARIEVDGVDISDETVGTTTGDIPASAIQEFQLSQSSMDLSTELTSSGAVNVVTKSGTNSYHGEGFGLFRDSSIAAQLPHPTGIGAPFQRTQYGGNFGGAAIKDKLFFFLDAERTLQHLGAPVLQPAPFQAYSGTFPAPFKEAEAIGRLDYQINGNAKAFYRYSYFQNSDFATFFPTSFQVYNNTNYTRNHLIGLDFSTGSFTHSIRFSYLKFQNEIVDATQGTSLPFANYPVSMAIGLMQVGPNYLAPQSTPQSNRQLKYDGAKTIGNHILRYGASYNRIQGGGFASFFSITTDVFGSPALFGCAPVVAGCTPGIDGSMTSNPANYLPLFTYLGSGPGFSTEKPAFGFPGGGLGPDNRIGFYFGDTWKIKPNFTLTAGVRYSRDTGRTDSDIAPIAALNNAFPGYGNRVNNPSTNFGPQVGLIWDPWKNGKTVFRAGAGLYYENVIYNNVLFDRPLRLQKGAFLYTPNPCVFGNEGVVQSSVGPLTLSSGWPGAVSSNPCAEPIGAGAATMAAFQKYVQSVTTPNPNAPNASFVGNNLANGLDTAVGLFAPQYKSPQSTQMNIGVQREIRRGLVLNADYVRNVTIHTLLGVDINHVGDASDVNPNFDFAGAVQATNSQFTSHGVNCGTLGASAGINCAIAGVNALNNHASMVDYAGSGITSAADFSGPGGGCPAGGCAFGGLKPQYGTMPFLFPIGRSVYSGLQMKLVQQMQNPLRGFKNIDFQVSYALSRFTNAGGWQGSTVPSAPSQANDQDFVINAMDNNQPLRYTGPSLLDRTNQISFGGNFQMPFGIRWGVIAHFYSPLSSPVVVGATGSSGDIFRTDFTGDGTVSDPLPGTKNGAFGRDFGVSGLAQRLTAYNATIANTATPAGQALISKGIFSLAQLQALGGVAPTINAAPISTSAVVAPGQASYPWVRALDLKLSWVHRIKDRVEIEPSVGFYNLPNWANFDNPPGIMNGWVNASGGGSINTTQRANDPYRVGVGTGVFGLGQPRVLEFGLRASF